MTRILTPNKRWESWDDEDKSEDMVSQSPEFGSEFVRTLLTFIYNRMEQTMNVSHLSVTILFTLTHGAKDFFSPLSYLFILIFSYDTTQMCSAYIHTKLHSIIREI